MTMKTKLIVIGLLLTYLTGCNEEEPTREAPAPPTAEVALTGMLLNNDGSYAVGTAPYGSATFVQEDSFVVATIRLENFLPNTVHAIHLHAGSCENPGMHWNMGKDMTTTFCNEKSLGIPWAKPMAGDVGNASVGYDGSGTLVIKTDLWEIGTATDRDITGTVLVIHEAYEDFTKECDPTHGAHPHDNAKIACGTLVQVTQ